LSRSPGSEPRPRARAARALAALWLCSAAAAAQAGAIQREQKLCSRGGGFTGAIGNDYRFGVSVAELGDFDRDGVRDLAVGSHRANLGGAERGAVWLLLMNSDGTVREHRQISAVAGKLPGPLDDHDRFGISISSLGDLDLDGTTDIAVGAYRDDDGGTDHGCVYVLFLAPDGTVARQRKISSLQGGFGGTLRAEDSFGWSVENVGDLDDDGVIDLVVGATRDDGGEPDPALDYGALYVLFLREDGTVRKHARIGAGGGSCPPLRRLDRFGSDVVLLEDADGDGVEDIAVGAFSEDPLQCGRIFVLHLLRDGRVKDHQEIGRSTGGFTGSLGRTDRFGISLAADDLDGDGVHDLLVGALGDDDGASGAGAVWVCLLDALGRVRSTEKISSGSGGFGGLLHAGDNFGTSCAALGDLDRDGAVDLAVGAYRDDTGGTDRGAAWVLFRTGTGAPVADFVSAPPTGEPPLSVRFEDRSSGGISSWIWDFGDGTSASERSPVHVYRRAGVHDVTLTVRGPLGSDSLRRQRAVVVRVPELELASFTAVPSQGPAPLAVGFVDLSAGEVFSWDWDFGDGARSTLRSPQHVYQEPGSYTVSLTVAARIGRKRDRLVLDRKTVPDLIRVLP
jgi:hypothetical protein